jgi:hypothetical protein
MISVALYALLVGLFLAAAAALLEEPIRRAGRATRWLWLGALIGSVVAPAVLWFVPLTLDRQPVSSASGDGGVAVSTTTGPASPSAGSAGVRGAGTVQRTLADRFASASRLDFAAVTSGVGGGAVGQYFIWVALGGPLAIVLIVGFDAIRVARLRRRWTAGEMDGTAVAFSDDFGPAIVGIVRPRIVVPRWVTSLEADQRALVLAHEVEHARAHDARLVVAAYALLACTPWNVVLWWHIHRLRMAIELDCDRRVLARQRDVARYGALLIEISRRMRPITLHAAAFAERRSTLRRRIEAMTEAAAPLFRRDSMARWSAVGVLAALACAVNPPTRQAVAVSEAGRVIVNDAPSLPPYVADSIADDRDVPGDAGGVRLPPIVAAARDLPAAFIPDTTVDSNRPENLCAQRLLDPRDSTKLLLIHSQTITYNADTARAASSIGLYSVIGPDRYGVTAAQVLRVGCSRELRTSTKAMDPALVSRINERVQTAFAVAPDSVTRMRNDLVVVFGPAFGAGLTTSERATRAREVAMNIWKDSSTTGRFDRMAVRFVSADGPQSRVTIYSYPTPTGRPR